mmetsp:Transcript_102583/g.313700  ORF Transcript_102583/g.313700 Transcript_102583/m.313700 type:complete len:295 (+) Transcript_102583:465-1349(+)
MPRIGPGRLSFSSSRLASFPQHALSARVEDDQRPPKFAPFVYRRGVAVLLGGRCLRLGVAILPGESGPDAGARPRTGREGAGHVRARATRVRAHNTAARDWHRARCDAGRVSRKTPRLFAAFALDDPGRRTHDRLRCGHAAGAPVLDGAHHLLVPQLRLPRGKHSLETLDYRGCARRPRRGGHGHVWNAQSGRGLHGQCFRGRQHAGLVHIPQEALVDRVCNRGSLDITGQHPRSAPGIRRVCRFRWRKGHGGGQGADGGQGCHHGGRQARRCHCVIPLLATLLRRCLSRAPPM